MAQPGPIPNGNCVTVSGPTPFVWVAPTLAFRFGQTRVGYKIRALGLGNQLGVRAVNRLGAIILCTLLAACVTNPVHVGYSGPNAGVLVYSVGMIGKDVEGYSFYYRKVGQPSGLRTGGDGVITYDLIASNTHDDYSGHEVGAVSVVWLEPGEYEIYTWRFEATAMEAIVECRPERDFSIKFTVKPQTTSYIGNFAWLSDLWRTDVSSGPHFVISNRNERDIPIARSKFPSLPTVVTMVPDVAGLGEPSLLSREPDRATSHQ